MSRARFTLYMQTEVPQHRRVYEAIFGTHTGKRSEFVIQLLNMALNQEELVYRAVKRALSEHHPHFPPPVPAKAIEPTVKAGQIPDEMLGFILSLQEEN